MPLIMPSPNISLSRFSSIHFSQHDIHTAKNDHHVGDDMAQAHVFEDGQVDEAWRTYVVTIRIGRAIADEVKSELAFGRFDASVSLARLGSEPAQLGFRIDDWPRREAAQGLLQDVHRLAHFEHPDHVTVVNVPVFTQRD